MQASTTQRGGFFCPMAAALATAARRLNMPECWLTLPPLNPADSMPLQAAHRSALFVYQCSIGEPAAPTLTAAARPPFSRTITASRHRATSCAIRWMASPALAQQTG